MISEIISTSKNAKFHCTRLHRGDDLLLSIENLCKEKNIHAGFIASGVGCILKGKIRDASGVNIRNIDENCEIVSLNGTVSAKRCHIHISLSKEDLSTIGGHLCEGCIINTTCELIIAEIPELFIDIEDDPETGYDELIFRI